MATKTNKLCDLIRESGISFGTSGARGLVDHFTQDTCSAFTQAFLHSLEGNYVFKSVAIAMDNRPSSYLIARYCAAALQTLSIDPVFYGVIPTPALALKAMKEKIPCIMVTGSHIPFDRNGLKFYTPEGEINKIDEQSIVNCALDIVRPDDVPLLAINNSAAEEYIARYVSCYSVETMKGKRIGIYEHSSAGRDLYSEIFSRLGASVIPLGRSDIFVPIDTEAVSEEDIAQAKTWSSEHKLDAIFSTDGDGDRPLLADENGIWLRGDILGLLAARSLSINVLAIPVSCNTAIEETGFFKSVVRTKIGSPYVIEAMKAFGTTDIRIAGFEANGGFLLGADIAVEEGTLKALPTRDAVLPAVAVMVDAFESGSISLKVKNLPERYTSSDRLQNIHSSKSSEIINSAINDPEAFMASLGLEDFKVVSINQLDGARLISETGDVIHFRPSGNAPELRCYAEASTEARAQHYVTTALKKIESI